MAAKSRGFIDADTPIEGPKFVNPSDIINLEKMKNLSKTEDITSPFHGENVVTEKDKPKEPQKAPVEPEKAPTEIISPLSEKPSTNQFNHAIGHLVRIPRLTTRDKARVNYAIRDTMHQDVTELSRLSGISVNVIVEYILEDYLFENHIQELDSALFLDCCRAVKHAINGIDDVRKKELQLNLPTFYINRVIENVEALNLKHGLKLDKATLVDVILEAKIREDL